MIHHRLAQVQAQLPGEGGMPIKNYQICFVKYWSYSEMVGNRNKRK